MRRIQSDAAFFEQQMTMQTAANVICNEQKTTGDNR